MYNIVLYTKVLYYLIFKLFAKLYITNINLKYIWRILNKFL